MTGTTNVDQFFTKNYKLLTNYCDNYNLDQDKINDIYLKTYKKTNLSGLTESELFMYVRRAIWNQLRDEHKMIKRRGRTYSVDDVDSDSIEHKLRAQEWDEEEYQSELQYLTKKVFKYIEERGIFSEIEVFILKSYVWTDVTYAELEKDIGISQDVCKKTMRKFRKDLRHNFIRWINKNDQRRTN